MSPSPPSIRLPRSLSSLETWSFGLTGHVGWIGTAPVIHAALGPQAIFVWLPGVIVSVLLNLQVQRLGKCWPDMAGGTPNYAARLLQNFPGLGRYVAIGYFLGWSAAPVVYALVLTDLIRANLEPLGIDCPEPLLKLGFTAIAFIVGFSGTRALGILHLFFVVPAILFLLAFCLQGIGWLALPTSPGLFPTHWSGLSFGEWAKWFFISTYSVYSCETASSFVADSRRPAETLRFLSFAAWLIPPVFLGGSWVLMRLATQPDLGENLYLNLLAAAQPFWGESASLPVTLLIAFCCLLSCATTVANTSRILYQLALDGQLSPVFAVVSRRGVLAPALLFTFGLSLFCLVWGNIAQVVAVTGTGYLISIMGLHLGLWLGRGRPEVRWPGLALGFLIVETLVLVVGGLAWGWQNLLMGLLFPLVILAVDAAIRRMAFAPCHPRWWLQRYSAPRENKIQDFVTLQVFVLIFLICSAATIGWNLSDQLNKAAGDPSADLLVILLVTLSFAGVAIACWTTLPQIAAIDEAREQAKNLFITALDTVPDTILVLDATGRILQANPAAAALLQRQTWELVGDHLGEFFATLAGVPEQWPTRSELALALNQHRIIEATLSQQASRERQEYLVILRDITERKQAEQVIVEQRVLRQSEERFRSLVQNSSDVILILEADQTIRYASASVHRVLDYSPENWVGTPVLTWVHPDDAQQMQNFLSECLDNLGVTPAIALQFQHQQGYWRWVEAVGNNQFDDPSVGGVVINFRDISERKSAEAKLQIFAAKLEQSNRELQDFASVASHDLQEPLRKIQAFGDRLKAKCGEALSDQGRDYLERMQQAANRMQTLITDLLTFSRVKTNAQPFVPVNLAEVVQEVLADLEVRIEQTSGRVEVGDLPTIDADPTQMRQLLQNLIANALKFHRKGETPIVKLHSLLSQVQPAGEALAACPLDTGPGSATGGEPRDQLCQIVVEDNGVGFDEKYLDRIFTIFQRLHGRTEYAGSGVGLAVCRRIAEHHSGSITAKSTPGQGATFIIMLPVKQPKPELDHEHPPSPA